MHKSYFFLQFDLAEKSFNSAEDLSGLLLLHTSTGNAEGLLNLAKVATEKGRNNIAFIAYFLLRRLEDCVELLCSTGRIPEAAFFARTYHFNWNAIQIMDCYFFSDCFEIPSQPRFTHRFFVEN